MAEELREVVGSGRRVWPYVAFCPLSNGQLFQGTREVAVGDSGCSRGGSRLWGSRPEKNSPGSLHGMESWPVGSLLQPSAPWTSYSKREGTEGAWQCLQLAAPPMTQPQPPGPDLLCPGCPAMAGPLTVPGCWKSSSIPRGRFIRTPQRGGRIQRFVLQKKKNRETVLQVSQPQAAQLGWPWRPHADWLWPQSEPSPGCGKEPLATKCSLIKKRKTLWKQQVEPSSNFELI